MKTGCSFRFSPHIIYSYKLFRFRSHLHVTKQNLCAGPAVTICMVMVKADAIVITQVIQPVTDSRSEPATHDHSTQSPDLRFPHNAVITQTFANHAHIKAGVMGNQNTAAHDRLNYFPQLRKRGRIRHKLRTYAGQLRVEPIKPLSRVHKIKILVYDFCIFHHTDADSAYAVIVPVRRFHIKNNVSGHNVILK